MIYRVWGGEGQEQSRMNPAFLSWGSMRWYIQANEEQRRKSRMGMEEGAVISLDWGVLNFFGDIQSL